VKIDLNITKMQKGFLGDVIPGNSDHRCPISAYMYSCVPFKNKIANYNIVPSSPLLHLLSPSLPFQHVKPASKKLD
jgi:hypothetical protein